MEATTGRPDRLSALAPASAALLAAAVALHPLLEPDIFWHLAAGRWILEHGAVPRVDVFTYTMAGREWLDFQWLFDVLVATGWREGGPDALILGKVVALAAAAALLARAALVAGAGGGAAALVTGLAVVASAERTTERPEIVSYVALALVALAIERARRGAPRRALIAVPLLVALWINLHALAFLGPVLLLASAAGAFLEGAPARRLARDLAATGAASAVALLANPYGVAAWTFPATLFRRVGVGPDVFGRILEFASPLDSPGDPALRFFWVLLAVALASFAARGRRLPWGRLVPLLPFLLLALMARRNIPLFAIVAVPATAVNVAALAGRFAGMPAVSLAAACVVAGLATAVVAGASPTLLGLARERGLGVMPGLFPERCLETADRLGLDGRLFHDLDFGGYVAWRDPARKTFIDGRLEVVGPESRARFIEAHESPVAWERLRAEWDFDLLLLEHSSRGSAAFLRAQLASGEWRLACLSPEAVLLVSRRVSPAATSEAALEVPSWNGILGGTRAPAPGAGDALRAVAIPLDGWLRPRPAPSAVRRAARLANLYLTLGRVAEARAGYEAILTVAPDDAEALFNRGMCALRAGRPAEAKALWEEAMPRVDRASRDLFRSALDELVE